MKADHPKAKQMIWHPRPSGSSGRRLGSKQERRLRDHSGREAGEKPALAQAGSATTPFLKMVLDSVPARAGLFLALLPALPWGPDIPLSLHAPPPDGRPYRGCGAAGAPSPVGRWGGAGRSRVVRRGWFSHRAHLQAGVGAHAGTSHTG